MNLKDKLKIYIENNYKKNNWMEELFSFKNTCDDIEDIDTYINDNKEDYTFKEMLFKYIDDRNLKDSDVYNKVHIDRRLFNKIKNIKNYIPKKKILFYLVYPLSYQLKNY